MLFSDMLIPNAYIYFYNPNKIEFIFVFQLYLYIYVIIATNKYSITKFFFFFKL